MRPDNLLAAVSTKLNLPALALLDSDRTFRILSHYKSWLARPGHDNSADFAFAVARACHDICGCNGPASERKEPRL